MPQKAGNWSVLNAWPVWGIHLAAGVAHEINNPLNIMSGYAELTIKRLQRLGKNETDAEVIEHLSIIRSEAFRCKEITQKLLSLAKGNGDQREPVSITDAVNEVATMVRGVKSFQTKQLDVNLNADDLLTVTANTTEIKQVLLNLIVNAIEAVGDNSGRVVITGRRTDQWVELDVVDNGRGMTPQTRERAFEPFLPTSAVQANRAPGWVFQSPTPLSRIMAVRYWHSAKG